MRIKPEKLPNWCWWLQQLWESEKIYKEDLAFWPKNGFALSGLYESLKGQNKMKEADEVKKQFEKTFSKNRFKNFSSI